MKIVLFYEEPEQEIKNYDKNGYIVIDGNYINEKDILQDYCEKQGLNKDFWYKLQIKPIELTLDMKVLLPKGIKFAYEVLPKHNKNLHDVKTYRLTKTLRVTSFTTKDGLVVQLPEGVDVSNNTFFFYRKSNCEHDLTSIKEALNNWGIEPIILDDNVELVTFEELL